MDQLLHDCHFLLEFLVYFTILLVLARADLLCGEELPGSLGGNFVHRGERSFSNATDHIVLQSTSPVAREGCQPIGRRAILLSSSWVCLEMVRGRNSSRRSSSRRRRINVGWTNSANLEMGSRVCQNLIQPTCRSIDQSSLLTPAFANSPAAAFLASMRARASFRL